LGGTFLLRVETRTLEDPQRSQGVDPRALRAEKLIRRRL